jgi:hypothetical protein
MVQEKKLYACRLKWDLPEEAASLLTEGQKDELKMSSTLLSGLKSRKKWRDKSKKYMGERKWPSIAILHWTSWGSGRVLPLLLMPYRLFLYITTTHA